MPKKNEKTILEKATKVLSPKRQLEADHLAGKHKAEGKEALHSQASANHDCGFCQRRYVKSIRKESATKRFFAGSKK